MGSKYAVMQTVGNPLRDATITNFCKNVPQRLYQTNVPTDPAFKLVTTKFPPS